MIDNIKVESLTDKKEPEPAKPAAPLVAKTSFDFSVDTELMDEQTKYVYLLLHHRAAARNDNELLPDGKKLTQAQVEEMLGQTLSEAQVVKRCCGGTS
jgi:hypothetical protein